ncbi:hypothetical protein JCGZ_22836 [Jatropha curcas]|uniref:Transmembrane protein n=1 Tax=Jatropha curcas TaxID=180498 RepID=A0A067JQF8_JATCU|nr:hypothetical protein JCGZ_22836 [Jatropha curcas]
MALMGILHSHWLSSKLLRTSYSYRISSDFVAKNTTNVDSFANYSNSIFTHQIKPPKESSDAENVQKGQTPSSDPSKIPNLKQKELALANETKEELENPKNDIYGFGNVVVPFVTIIPGYDDLFWQFWRSGISVNRVMMGFLVGCLPGAIWSVWRMRRNRHYFEKEEEVKMIEQQGMLEDLTCILQSVKNDRYNFILSVTCAFGVSVYGYFMFILLPNEVPNFPKELPPLNELPVSSNLHFNMWKIWITTNQEERAWLCHIQHARASLWKSRTQDKPKLKKYRHARVNFQPACASLWESRARPCHVQHACADRSSYDSHIDTPASLPARLVPASGSLGYARTATPYWGIV